MTADFLNNEVRVCFATPHKIPAVLLDGIPQSKSHWRNRGGETTPTPSICYRPICYRRGGRSFILVAM